MKRSLARLLRVRSLLEDLAHRRLEGTTAALRRLEDAAVHQQQLSLRTRSQALDLLSSNPPADPSEWLTGIADADLLSWKSGQLAALADAARPAVEEARAQLLTRRIEHRQLKTLLDEAAHAEQQERGRQEQRQIDDAFHSRAAFRRRRLP